MRESASPRDPFEPYKRMPDGRMVRFSEAADYERTLRQKEKGANERKTENVDVSRRKFLIGGAAAVTAAALGGLHQITSREVSEQEDAMPSPEAEAPQEATREALITLEEKSAERGPNGEGWFEQISKYGKIKSVQSGVRSVYATHYSYLVQNPKGRRDMEVAVENLKQMNLEQVVAPFVENGFHPIIAVLIAIQESRGRVVTSWAGARGIFGIMPKTAENWGFKPNAVDDPIQGAHVSAAYIKEERRRFGDDIDLLLHAYNGGGSLFGFSKAFPKEQRTKNNFYRYMESILNARYRDAKEKGYFSVSARKKDTLTKLCNRHSVKLEELVKMNHIKNPATYVVLPDAEFKIPFAGTKEDLDKLFRKEFEILHYAPEVRAKYDALSHHGLLKDLEVSLNQKGSTIANA